MIAALRAPQLSWGVSRHSMATPSIIRRRSIFLTVVEIGVTLVTLLFGSAILRQYLLLQDDAARRQRTVAAFRADQPLPPGVTLTFAEDVIPADVLAADGATYGAVSRAAFLAALRTGPYRVSEPAVPSVVRDGFWYLHNSPWRRNQTSTRIQTADGSWFAIDTYVPTQPGALWVRRADAE